jgi:hypothetical protein
VRTDGHSGIDTSYAHVGGRVAPCFLPKMRGCTARDMPIEKRQTYLFFTHRAMASGAEELNRGNKGRQAMTEVQANILLIEMWLLIVPLWGIWFKR